MPREIRKLADSVLTRPAVVELAHSQPAETIAHALYPLSEGDKVGALERLLSGDDFRSAIVFLRTKRRAKRLAKQLATSAATRRSRCRATCRNPSASVPCRASATSATTCWWRPTSPRAASTSPGCPTW